MIFNKYNNKSANNIHCGINSLYTCLYLHSPVLIIENLYFLSENMILNTLSNEIYLKRYDVEFCLVFT